MKDFILRVWCFIFGHDLRYEDLMVRGVSFRDITCDVCGEYHDIQIHE